MPEEQKDPAAQSMAKKRWAKTTKKERSDVARELNAARWAGHEAKRPAASRKKVKKKP